MTQIIILIVRRIETGMSFESSNLKASISSISNTGRVEINFNRAIQKVDQDLLKAEGISLFVVKKGVKIPNKAAIISRG